MSGRMLRARVHAGRFEPMERISIPEGTEVSLRVEQANIGTPASVLAAVRRAPELERGDIDELRKSIAEGRVPTQTEGVFERRR